MHLEPVHPPAVRAPASRELPLDPGLLSVNEHAAPSSGLSSPTITVTHCPDRLSAGSLSTSEPQKRRVSGTDCTDLLTRIRPAALDLLTPLRELEESTFPREPRDKCLVLMDPQARLQDRAPREAAGCRRLVVRYLNTVYEVLFGRSKSGVKGWVYEQERAARKERPKQETRGTWRGKGWRSIPIPSGKTSRAYWRYWSDK
ncbi:hypothetical protein EDB83DRAFT_2514663 [Lactarius deliciosus]|nr:hypothetical protein EDB83DRAFT_2514663 [Lactarius deliciosus]